MKPILLLIALSGPIAAATELQPVANPDLSIVLGLLEELHTGPQASAQPYLIRVFAAPVGLAECGGSISSCPDVRLFITASSGDLGDAPDLYSLPPAKGWRFVGWEEPRPGTVGLILETALPDSNIDIAERQQWRPQRYHVRIGPRGARYDIER